MFLIPLILLIFIGTAMSFGPDFSSQEQLQEAGATVIAAVDDPARRAEVEKTVDKIFTEAKLFSKRFQTAQKQIKKQYKNHAAGADEAFTVLSQLSTDWEASQERMADLQFDLREQLTEEEWDEIYDPTE